MSDDLRPFDIERAREDLARALREQGWDALTVEYALRKVLFNDLRQFLGERHPSEIAASPFPAVPAMGKPSGAIAARLAAVAPWFDALEDACSLQVLAQDWVERIRSHSSLLAARAPDAVPAEIADLVTRREPFRTTAIADAGLLLAGPMPDGLGFEISVSAGPVAPFESWERSVSPLEIHMRWRLDMSGQVRVHGECPISWPSQ